MGYSIDQPIFLTKPFNNMKKLFLLLSGALLFANLFVSTGCGEDDTVDPVDQAPLVLLNNTPVDNIAPGADITFSVDATVGTAELNSLTITEDAVDVDPARITIENIAVANNPQLITDADKNGLVWNITITGPDAPGTYTYEVTVADDAGLTDFSTFDVTVEDPTTPISFDESGILLNQAGPAGTGGLDLDTGDGTGSAEPEAEIRDWGIDLALPAADNWIQKIGAANDNIVRVVDQSSEIFDFDGVATEEAIADTWSKATDLTDNMSEVVIVGDVFAVENATTGRLYLIRIDEVNVTAGDNTDNYVISIKY